MKQRQTIGLLFIIFVFSFVNPLQAETPEEIMQKVYDRDNGSTQVSMIKLSTCRYTINDNKMGCVETPRIKVMESVRKDFGKNLKDSKSVIIILEPASERGIGFLQFDWDDPDKETDQWMYFSALGKVKRIISGNEDEPKTGSFFGTEITYEDLEARHIEDYAYKLLGEETYQNRPCWVVESIPTLKRAKTSNYSKSINWIDQERYLSLKSILYNRQGRRVKRITNSSIEKINGIWVMREMLVNNIETKRLTTFKLESTAYNLEVEDQFLTQRTLTDSVFREQNLEIYRAVLK
ncbi:outer membrane lipoprotein-sorting protein [bacterium]|nr:outer membrane lipoprotein-sorting protein [bacterium]